MLKRSLLAVTLAAGAALSAPAQATAAPNLIVISYFSSLPNGDLVGQKWWGCPGQPPGQWGVETPHRKVSFNTPCS